MTPRVGYLAIVDDGGVIVERGPEVLLTEAVNGSTGRRYLTNVSQVDWDAPSKGWLVVLDADSRVMHWMQRDEVRIHRDGFTCPRCGRTSYHPQDRRQGYCGACHDWTGER